MIDFLGHDAGSSTGSCKVLGPVRTEVEPRLSQFVLEPRIAEEIDTYPLCVGQQENIVLACDLPEQGLKSGTGGSDQPFGLFPVLAQLGIRYDMGWIGTGRVHSVDLDTAAPAFGNRRITPRRMTKKHPLDFGDVVPIAHTVLPR
ncbi:MAG: hypothetical protein R3D87_11965 [Paracoccaceae bacterium]